MKKFVIAGALVISVILIVAGCISVGPEPIPITYYYSENCTTCNQMDNVFNNLTNSYRGQFTLTKYDINKEQVKFYNDQITHGGDGSIPFVFVSNLTLNGYRDNAYTILEYYIVHREELRNATITSQR